MNPSKQTISDVAMIARNAIDRMIEFKSNKLDIRRTWVGLPTIVILDIYAETLKTHRGGSMPEGQIVFAKAIEQALKERNT